MNTPTNVLSNYTLQEGFYDNADDTYRLHFIIHNIRVIKKLRAQDFPKAAEEEDYFDDSAHVEEAVKDDYYALEIPHLTEKLEDLISSDLETWRDDEYKVYLSDQHGLELRNDEKKSIENSYPMIDIGWIKVDEDGEIAEYSFDVEE